jgi:hypothetical protein
MKPYLGPYLYRFHCGFQPFVFLLVMEVGTTAEKAIVACEAAIRVISTFVAEIIRPT